MSLIINIIACANGQLVTIVWDHRNNYWDQCRYLVIISRTQLNFLSKFLLHLIFYHYCTFNIISLTVNTIIVYLHQRPGRPFQVFITSTLGFGWIRISSFWTSDILPPPFWRRSLNRCSWSSSSLIWLIYSKFN